MQLIVEFPFRNPYILDSKKDGRRQENFKFLRLDRKHRQHFREECLWGLGQKVKILEALMARKMEGKSL